MWETDILVGHDRMLVSVRGLPVGLEGDLIIASHLTEVLLQLPEELLVTLSLVQGTKGMKVGKLIPGDGLKQLERGNNVRNSQNTTIKKGLQ